MRRLFSLSRYVIYIAVISLMLATLAVFVFGFIATVTVIFEAFGHGDFGAEGARVFSVELIEMIDLFLLGTILFITAVGLQELFVDPALKEVLPEWMSVASLDQLKFNLLAVIVVMLAVLFLGVAAAFELGEGNSILDYGLGIGAVVLASGITVYLFARVHHMRAAHEEGQEVENQTGELE
jgi:uncharacterized membrane protein YqhA